MVLDENATAVPLNATFYKLDLLHKMTYRQTDWHLKTRKLVGFNSSVGPDVSRGPSAIWHCLVHNGYTFFMSTFGFKTKSYLQTTCENKYFFSSDLKKESRTKDIVEVEAAKKFSDLLLLRNQTDSREHQQHLPFYLYCHLGLTHIAICKENFWLIVCCMFKCTSAKQRSGEHCQQSG